MSKSYMFIILLILLTGLLVLESPILAENNIDRLIMSEIHIDKNEPAKNFIEIYNPTDKPLTLIRLRLSTLLTPNILPYEYRDGIVLSAHEKIIVCANEDFLGEVSHPGIRIIEAEPLKVTCSGGFFAIVNKESTSVPIDVVRYGDPKRSDHVKAFSNIQVIPLPENGKSYSRPITENNGSISVADFIESVRSPGDITIDR
ncbi:MAG: hypothetical protein JXB48_07765 [Candidatus Latescibacteria bacterium]|nr:hypothetical protein [Candidatus Latescibacterota bacterium]